jgi:hypothetical protein
MEQPDMDPLTAAAVAAAIQVIAGIGRSLQRERGRLECRSGAGGLTMDHDLRSAIAVALAAWREHNLMLEVGGHDPQRLNQAMTELEAEFHLSRPTAGAAGPAQEP